MTDSNNKKARKSISIITTLALCFSALGGIGWGIYNITQSVNHSNDFSDGQSIQFNLRLYQVDGNGSPVIVNGEPKPIYSDLALEQEHLKSSTSALTNILQQKNLTNIKVSFGYSTVNNDKFPSKIEKVGALYATFENSESAFKLSDIKNPINDYLNNEKIFDTLNNSFKYEADLINPSYSGGSYTIEPTKQSTGRAAVARDPLAGIYYNETNKEAGGKNYNMYTGLETEDKFTGISTGAMKNKITIKSKQDLNTYAFATEKNEYDALAPADQPTNPAVYDHFYGNESWYTPTPYAEAPTEQQKFQTKYTWLLWKDKQGLINYLNSLIVLWYYNLYANEITIVKEGDATKPLSREHLNQIFNVSSPLYPNSADPDKRKQINEVISNLSETEKSFIAMVGQLNGTKERPETWRPQIIEEEDLIPVLYHYYNSKDWNSGYQEVTTESIPQSGFSTSVINGWGWLESADSEALKDLTGDYLVGKIDYKSFDRYFSNPDTSGSTEIKPYVTKDLYIPMPENVDISKYLNLVNNSISFPIINQAQYNFVNNYGLIQNQITALEKRVEVENIPFGEPDNPKTIAFKEDRKVFANKTFVSSNLFAEQKLSKPLYVDSWITNKLNPLDFLMIILGAILFIIGVFISIRYRIPGAIAFVISAFVFIITAALYNVFGFSFSFYSFIALAFGTFLSLLAPMFLCRNTLKEIRESATISASLVKSVKKHWKTAVDFHVISILCSISFLFFGIGGNINFGSMLIISVFLSFILSGIIYFVLMLFYTQYMQSNTFSWFLSKGYYAQLIKLNEPNEGSKFKNSWLYKMWYSFAYNVNLSSKSTYISFGIFILIAIAGVFVLGFVGSIFSIDFNNTNILVFKNFDQFNLSSSQISNLLNINVLQTYIYNNELFIYTSQTYDLANVTSTLEAFKPDIADLLTNNFLLTTMTTDISVQIVLNTLKCIGIAIGFSAIWAGLSLNIVSIIPLAFAQFIPIFVLSGFFGAVQFPLQLEITLIVSVIFMITSVISTASLSSLKASWNRDIEIEKNELKSLFTNIISKINLNFLIFIGLFIVLSLFSMFFTSLSLILIFTCFIIMLAWVGFYSNRILVFLWYQCILLRNLFSKEIQLNKHERNIKINYDFVDEQLISGINK